MQELSINSDGPIVLDYMTCNLLKNFLMGRLPTILPSYCGLEA